MPLKNGLISLRGKISYNRELNTFPSIPVRRQSMAVYVCEKCGMSIGTMTCGKCGKELVHSTITTDDGTVVHVSQCPDGHGKVKSPMCCGQDMVCPTA